MKMKIPLINFFDQSEKVVYFQLFVYICNCHMYKTDKSWGFLKVVFMLKLRHLHEHRIHLYFQQA